MQENKREEVMGDGEKVQVTRGAKQNPPTAIKSWK